MRRILVVGAGQSGLYLAHGLLALGYDVTLLTARTSSEIRYGKVAVTQLTFPTALSHERALNLDFWKGRAPSIDGMIVEAGPRGAGRFSFAGAFHSSGVSMDRRVKMADWLEAFEDRGGKVVVHGVTVTDLDYLAGMFDLTIVATGHGELGQIFDIDRTRSRRGRPRVAVDAFVYGVEEHRENTLDMGFYAFGSMFVVPSYTPYGPGHSLALFGKPGSPLDLSGERLNPVQLHARVLDLFYLHAPHLYEQVRRSELVDGQSVGIEYADTYVRDPVGVLPSGRTVLGMADSVLSVTPIALQGWNNSTMCARTYLERIVAHGDAPFDTAFMRDTFDEYWAFGQQAILIADHIGGVIEGEAPPHVAEILTECARNQTVADDILSALDDPPLLARMLATPDYLEGVRAGTGV
ncbi:styrene monooxygenase/indole monooxygenase family protein [Marinactinospora rubrisoli]|uniref:Styrene monooxygenase/indole monooxygenase family protein n=1 Tax=Marinactinospora rubrisoli TaxID=2715399 RepID=A0ABW2KC62_9ACTN